MREYRITMTHIVTGAIPSGCHPARSCLLALLIVLAAATGACAGGAIEGFGTTTPGGNDQPVYMVTHLGNCGPGSLRDAVSAGNRRVHFNVAGEIQLSHPDPDQNPACPAPAPKNSDPNIWIKGAFITIDGFSGPPPGITLVGGGLVIRGNVGFSNPTPAHDVIVRGLRIRNLPANTPFDGVQVAYGAFNVVLSNLSVWLGPNADGVERDGTIDVTENAHHVTLARNILAGAIKATLVKYSAYNVTLLGNLWVGGRNRNPQVSNDDAGTRALRTTIDMRNNVIYDWAGGAGTAIHHGAQANVVKNFYSSPTSLPVDQAQALIVCQEGQTCFDTKNQFRAFAYTEGNVSGDGLPFDINDVGTEDEPFDAPPITSEVDACTAAKRVLATAGVQGEHDLKVFPLDDVDRRFLDPISLAACRRTTTALASTAPSTLYGVPVTFTATVRVEPPAVGAASGSVTFYKGSSVVGVVPLAGGVAAVTVANLGLGSTTVRAVYSGNDDFDTSETILKHKVTGISTATVLTAAPSSSHLGAPVTLSATVTVAPPSAVTATGSVRFFDGSRLLGTVPLVNGVAILVTSTLPAGFRTVSAQFGGDLGLARSTSADVSLLVEGGTVTTLVASTRRAETAQPVTFTATVSALAGTGTPAGSVTFRGGPVNAVRPLDNGKAVFTTTTLPIGNHVIVATYNGSGNFEPSASKGIPASVVKGETRTALSATPPSLLLGRLATFTAVVTRTASLPGAPDGSVKFRNGGATLGTVNLSGGTAEFRTLTLGVGAYAITGAYSGSPTFEGSNSPKIKVIVNPKP